jgi:hypothetical protein
VEFVKIVGLSVGAAILYGILHDQVTARLCVEYFTVFHPYLGIDDPTLLGLVWGVLATWWVGLGLGILLALCAQVGNPPRLSAAQLVRPVAILLGCMAVTAILAGASGYQLGLANQSPLPEAMPRIKPEQMAGFLADVFAHLASYISGAVGGVVLSIWAVVHRARQRARQ